VLDRLRTILNLFPLSSFTVLTFLWSWSFWLFLAWRGIDYELRLWKYLYVAGLSGPLVASFAMRLIAGGKSGLWEFLQKILYWRFSPGLYALAILSGPALVLATVGIYDLIAPGKIELPHLTIRMGAVVFGYMILRGGPGNEEFGWRGLVLPALLQRWSPFRATLILIPIWAVWHCPLWWLRGLPHQFWPFSFFVMVLAPISFLFTWLYLQSRGSVLTAILFHSSINSAIHFLPILPPRYPGLGPFVLWIAITWAVGLLVLWLDRKRWFTAPANQCAGQHGGSESEIEPSSGVRSVSI